MKKSKFKNVRSLSIFLTKKEGKRTQVNIAQMNEILRILSDECYKHPEIIALIYKNGQRRSSKLD